MLKLCGDTSPPWNFFPLQALCVSGRNTICKSPLGHCHSATLAVSTRTDVEIVTGHLRAIFSVHSSAVALPNVLHLFGFPFRIELLNYNINLFICNIILFQSPDILIFLYNILRHFSIYFVSILGI